MKFLKDVVIIKAEKNKKAKQTVGGVEIEIVTKFNELDKDYVTQDGIVFGAPIALSSGQPIELKEGDKVYCHHFLCREENEVEIDGETYYKMGYNDVYCVVDEDGGIKPLGQWNLCDPMYEEVGDGEVVEKDDITGGMFKKSAAGIILSTEVKKDAIKAKVCYANSESKEMGLCEGDTILYRPDCDYEMVIEGKTYYRIRTKDIIGVYEVEAQ